MSLGALGRWAVCSALIALAGCAGMPPNVSVAERQAALKTAAVVHVVDGGSVPMVLTTTKDAVGAGALAIVTQAQALPPSWELKRRHGYPEPSALVQAGLAQRLQAGGSVRVQLEGRRFDFLARGIGLEQAVAGELRQHLPKALVLMVDVPTYQVIYKMKAWQTYHLANMPVRARLVDTGSGKVLWSHLCRVDNKGLNLAFDISEFEADNGARVKQVIETAARACVDELADGLTTAP